MAVPVTGTVTVTVTRDAATHSVTVRRRRTEPTPEPQPAAGGRQPGGLLPASATARKARTGTITLQAAAVRLSSSPLQSRARRQSLPGRLARLSRDAVTATEARAKKGRIIGFAKRPASAGSEPTVPVAQAATLPNLPGHKGAGKPQH